MFKNLKIFRRSKDFQILKFILIIFLGWRITAAFIAYFGLSILPMSIGSFETDWAPSTINYFEEWANWDGGHFRGIAENGYLVFQVVFFPLFPLLIKALMYLGIPSLWGGLIISNLSIIAALFLLYKLVLLDFDANIAKKTILITLAFPTAFYFGSVYSESLFLFLAVASLYFARKKRWLYALIFAGFSSVARLGGLAVILAVGFEYYLKTINPPTFKEFILSFPGRFVSYIIIILIAVGSLEKILSENRLYLYLGAISFISSFLPFIALSLIIFFISKFLFSNLLLKKVLTRQTLFFLLSLLPFSLYCLYLYINQGDLFAFVDHERQWQRHLTLPWSAPIIYFRKLHAVGFFQVGQSAQILIEFLFFCFYFILLLISYAKLRISYSIFFALSLFLPVMTGTLSAIHRYGLIIFPVMILLARIKSEPVFFLWLYFSLMLQGVLLVLFFNSYWVS